MIDWNRNPNKSKEEVNFENKLKRYKEMFGEDFNIIIGITDDADAEIDHCLKFHEKQKKPVFEEGCVY